MRIAGRRHHPARPAAADHRPLAQRRAIALLDRGTERIAIDVGERQAHRPSRASARQSRQKPGIDWLLLCDASPGDRGLAGIVMTSRRSKMHRLVRGGHARHRPDRSRHAPQSQAATLPRRRGDREFRPRIPAGRRQREVALGQCPKPSGNGRGALDRQPKMPEPEWPKARPAAGSLACASPFEVETPFGCSLEICPRTFISKNFDPDKLCRSLELELI
jgi:hypothetical protein